MSPNFSYQVINGYIKSEKKEYIIECVLLWAEIIQSIYDFAWATNCK